MLSLAQTSTLTNSALFTCANSQNEQYKCLRPLVLPGKPTLHTLHRILMPCLRMRMYGLVSWKKKKKNLANHRLSLVLMKGNNSLTCTKTVQKPPFLMSDISRPRDAFYVSYSLIKQHLGERDRGHMKCVCVCMYVSNLGCLNCQVWFGDSDLHTTRFNHTSCSAIYRFSFLKIYPFSFWAKRWASFFFLLFVKHWILKESKVRSGIPCSEVCYPQKNEGE